MNSLLTSSKLNSMDNKLEYTAELIRNSLHKYAGGIYTFSDNRKILVVDTKHRMVGHCQYLGDPIEWYLIGEESSKDNGYVYALISMPDTGKDDQFGQHQIIKIVSDIADYDRSLQKYGGKMVICHKNGCPWDNIPANMEWGTQHQNKLQAKIVHSLHYYFPDTYTEIMHNLSDKDFVTVKQPIENKAVADFMRYGYDVPTAKDEYPSLNVINVFINFMFNNGYWI